MFHFGSVVGHMNFLWGINGHSIGRHHNSEKFKFLLFSLRDVLVAISPYFPVQWNRQELIPTKIPLVSI